jgi:hypothetical protein
MAIETVSCARSGSTATAANTTMSPAFRIM